MDPLGFAASFRPTLPLAPGRKRADYAPQLVKLRGRKASGVYAIFDARSRRLLYIGESHTGRLYDTITRHFRAWRPENDPQGRRRAGAVRTGAVAGWRNAA